MKEIVAIYKKPNGRWDISFRPDVYSDYRRHIRTITDPHQAFVFAELVARHEKTVLYAIGKGWTITLDYSEGRALTSEASSATMSK